MPVKVDYPFQGPDSKRSVTISHSGGQLVARRISRDHKDLLSEAFVLDPNSLDDTRDFIGWMHDFILCRLPTDALLKADKPKKSKKRDRAEQDANVAKIKEMNATNDADITTKIPESVGSIFDPRDAKTGRAIPTQGACLCGSTESSVTTEDGESVRRCNNCGETISAVKPLRGVMSREALGLGMPSAGRRIRK